MRTFVIVAVVAAAFAAGCESSNTADSDVPATSVATSETVAATTTTLPPTTVTTATTPPTSQTTAAAATTNPAEEQSLPEPAQVDLVVSEAEPTTISGTGRTVISLLSFPQGWLVVESNASPGPDEGFVLWVEEEGGGIVDVVALSQTDEPYVGSAVLDKYGFGSIARLVVDGLSGPWDLRIIPVELVEAVESPIIVEGTDNRAFVVKGNPSTAVIGGNAGATDQGFTVLAFGPDRARYSLLTTGSEVDAEVVEIPDAVTLYMVESETDWTIGFS